MVVFLFGSSLVFLLLGLGVCSLAARDMGIGEWCICASMLIILFGCSAGCAYGGFRQMQLDESGWVEVCDESHTTHGMVMAGKVMVPTTYQQCVRKHYECPSAKCGDYQP